jgi:hypothetical protein
MELNRPVTHPLAALQHKRRWLIVLLVTVLTLTIVLAQVGPSDPDIVGFEFAWTTDRAAQIIQGWSAEQQIRAGFSLGLDYLYLTLYSTLIALACVGSAMRTTRPSWRRLGLGLGWALWLAAAADAVENAALYRTLLGPVTDPYPAIAGICASVKFALVVAGVAYAAAGAVAWWRSRSGSSDPGARS